MKATRPIANIVVLIMLILLILFNLLVWGSVAYLKFGPIPGAAAHDHGETATQTKTPTTAPVITQSDGTSVPMQKDYRYWTEDHNDWTELMAEPYDSSSGVEVYEDGSGRQYAGDDLVRTFPEGTFAWDCKTSGNRVCGPYVWDADGAHTPKALPQTR